MERKKKKKFIIAFRELTRVINKLKTFTEFKFTEEELGMSNQMYEDYKSKYFEAYRRCEKQEKASILNDVDFEIELMNIDKINVDYITRLIKNLDLSNNKEVKKKTKEIKEYLDKSGNIKLRLKSELLKEFLDKVIPEMGEFDSIDDKLDEYMQKAKEKEILDFATNNNLDIDELKELIYEQEFVGFVKSDHIDKIMIHLKFKEKRYMKEKIRNFAYEHIERFSY